MGRFSGFKYRQIVKRLKALGFVFDRHAAGSHEIWYNEKTDLYTTIPNHPETCLKARCGPFCDKPVSNRKSS
jgi:predicted RNA binding protein YcfA (HicA-like mRNA interferase family)